MPELPEVETTRRGLATVLPGRSLRQLIVHEARMRWPVPDSMAGFLQGQELSACRRRGKYLLLDFSRDGAVSGTQIVHLGMSGSLRRALPDEPRRKHDHIEWLFGPPKNPPAPSGAFPFGTAPDPDSARFLLHDPRRFGCVLWHPADAGPVLQHPLLAGLGLEPFDPEFTPEALHAGLRGRRVAIKQLLLAGRLVVGVGNIYASESLYLAQIDPRTPAGQISLARCERLHGAILQTLNWALESGGSTLRDYVNASGSPGSYFSTHAVVYEHEGQACPRCAGTIKRIVQGQRATYFCPGCQKP